MLKKEKEFKGCRLQMYKISRTAATDINRKLSPPNFKYISPKSNGKSTDWGGVPSICSSWDQQLSNHRHEIAGILFNNSDWLCRPFSIGNKLGLYFQARTFAALHGVQFHIYPPCSKEDQFDNLVAWLPQNTIVNNINDQIEGFEEAFNITITTTLERMCKCRGPIAHQCKEGWSILSNTWHYEIRSALQDRASSSSLQPLSSSNQHLYRGIYFSIKYISHILYFDYSLQVVPAY